MEQKVKALLGELLFNVAVLQSQNETIQQELSKAQEELGKYLIKNEDKPKRKTSD